VVFMSKRSRIWNESSYRKFIREGHGQGEGTDYIPWIRIQDFPSKGMVSRIKGGKTGRIHHLLSNNEMRLFYLLDWSDDVLDIREQYPLLDLRTAIEIADTAQIRYPYDPVSGFPYVMTSDFYIVTVKGITVVSVKTTQELEKERVLEKLEIERRYWSKHNINWKIATENEINQIKAKNIEWLSQSRDLGCFPITSEIRERCVDYFLTNYDPNPCLISELITAVEVMFMLPAGMGINIYKHLAYWKRIDFDIYAEVDCSIFADSKAKIYV